MSKYLEALRKRRQAFQTGGTVESIQRRIGTLNAQISRIQQDIANRSAQGEDTTSQNQSLEKAQTELNEKQAELATAQSEVQQQNVEAMASAKDTPTGQEAIAGQSADLSEVTASRPDSATLPDATLGLAPDISADEEASKPYVTAQEDIQQLETGRAQDTATITKEDAGQATPQDAAQVSTAFSTKGLTPAQQQAASQEFQNTPEMKEYKELSDQIFQSEEYISTSRKLSQIASMEQAAGQDPSKSKEVIELQKKLAELRAPLEAKNKELSEKQKAFMAKKEQELGSSRPSVETATIDVALTQEIQDELGPPQGSAAKVLEQVDVTTVKSSKETGQGLAEQGIDNEISNAIANDPEGALEKLEGTDIESRANIADLPEEALMSAQMEGLLAGMEEGKTPLWAKPAVDKVNAMLAARGMSASTVGRDQLFNAIIQSAMPIAQDNAKALQARAAQKLDAAVKFKSQEAEFEQQMKITNLSNQQEAYMAKLKFKQENMLSDQASKNAAAQFNATSENQTQQFMASLQNNIEQFNVAAENAMKQFNITEQNKMEALNAGNELAFEQFNTQQINDMAKFYEQNELAREQFNVTNAQAIEQSNIAWRRSTNTAATAATNAANQQNVQNAFNMSTLEQTNLWQQLRDTGSYIRDAYQRDQDRKTTLLNTVLGLENMTKYKQSSELTRSLDNINAFLSELDF